MSKLQTMVELTEKHVPQDSTCVRGRNLTLGSARLYTLGVFLVVGIFHRNIQHLDNVSFISSNKLLSRVESLHFPSMDTEFSPLERKRKKKSISFSSKRGQFYSQPSSGTANSQWSLCQEQRRLSQEVSLGKPSMLLLPTRYALGNRKPMGRYKIGSSTVKTARWARWIKLPMVSLDDLDRNIFLFLLRQKATDLASLGSCFRVVQCSHLFYQ